MSSTMFDPWQQTFTLSLMANGDSGMQKLSSAQLQQDLTQSITAKLGDPNVQGVLGSEWKIGWGPYVYQAPSQTAGVTDSTLSGVADNAMWVAWNSETNTYVLAVAATNFVSNFDWMSEDANIKPEVPWPYGGTVPGGTIISPGAQLGVDKLLSMPSQGQTGPSLVSYMQSVQSSSATLIFTGHSLGGALAPALAVALFTAPQNDLSISSWQRVFVYPTAGPTPGNQEFYQLFSQMFPQQPSPDNSPWKVWNSLVWNSLDVVPHAWNLTTLNQIHSLYQPHFSPGAASLVLLERAITSAQGTDYVQLPSYGALPGTFAQLVNLAPFLDEALYQHVTAYFYLLQVQELLNFNDAQGKPLFGLPRIPALTPHAAGLA